MKKSEVRKMIREKVKKLREEPDTYVSKTSNGFTLIHKGMPVMSSDRTMNDVKKMAKKMKLKIGPKLWNNGKWETIKEGKQMKKSEIRTMIREEVKKLREKKIQEAQRNFSVLVRPSKAKNAKSALDKSEDKLDYELYGSVFMFKTKDDAQEALDIFRKSNIY